MSEWQQAASGAGAPDEVVALLEQSATGHGLFECARGGSGEIGLGAEPDAYAAVYVGRSGLSLALSPEQAADLASACGLSRLEKNPTTHYVRVPAGWTTGASRTGRERRSVSRSTGAGAGPGGPAAPRPARRRGSRRHARCTTTSSP